MPNTVTPDFLLKSYSDETFTVASNDAITYLSAPASNSDTTINVVSTTNIEVPCLLNCENELILARSKTSNTFTQLVRGYNGTTAASHGSDAKVFNSVNAYLHNRIASEFKTFGNQYRNKNLTGFSQRSNKFTYSENFASSDWTKVGGVTIAASNIVSPTGSTNATAIQEVNSSSAQGIGRSIAFLNPSVLSVYVKYNNVQWVALGSQSSVALRTFFDIQNGVIGTVGSNCKPVMLDVGGGWYRLMIELTSATTSVLGVFLTRTNGTITNVGDGSGIFNVWGIQLQNGTIMDSDLAYNPTLAETVDYTNFGGFVVDEGELV